MDEPDDDRGIAVEERQARCRRRHEMQGLIEHAALAQNDAPGKDPHEPVRPEGEDDQQEQNLLHPPTRRAGERNRRGQADQGAEAGRPESELDRAPGDVDEIGPSEEGEILIEGEHERAVAEGRRLQEREEQHRA